MPFVTGGHPSLDVTAELLPALSAAGASIIEVGIPFSDPIADGPVIAALMHRALQDGITPTSIFQTVQSVRDRVNAGLIAMLSNSIVQRIGNEKFLNQAATAGFDGIIVPDADTMGGVDSPAAKLAKMASDAGLTCTFLIAPTTSDARIAELASISTGFIYLLARVGITGEKSATPEVEQHVARVRDVSDLPIAVGFGISNAHHVAAVTKHADAAIVGSALVKRIDQATDAVQAATGFVADLVTGLRRS